MSKWCVRFTALWAALLALTALAAPAPAQEPSGTDPSSVRRRVAPPSATGNQTPAPAEDSVPEWARVKPPDGQPRADNATRFGRFNKTDAQLQADINRGMKLALFINSDKVNVGVKNGEVVLTGQVLTWVERGAAERIAYGSGAVYVRNYLKVTFGPTFNGR